MARCTMDDEADQDNARGRQAPQDKTSASGCSFHSNFFAVVSGGIRWKGGVRVAGSILSSI